MPLDRRPRLLPLGPDWSSWIVILVVVLLLVGLIFYWMTSHST